jgi:hypothetical protein
MTQNDIFIEHAIKIKNKKKLKIKNINNIVDSKFEKPQYLFLTYKKKNGFQMIHNLVNETLKLTVTENDIKKQEIVLDISDKNIWTDKDFFCLSKNSRRL